MNYFKQILYELKNQKMVTWVSISGTALAIFLIMAIFMADRLDTLDIVPDTNRSRILIGMGIHFTTENGYHASDGIDHEFATKLYGNLDGIERTSYYSEGWYYPISLPQGKDFKVQNLSVDHEYWKMYDYKFLSGKPFDEEDMESDTRLIILTESVARKLFGETDVAGREVMYNDYPYVVKGVVEDVHPLVQDGAFEVFLKYKPNYKRDSSRPAHGNTKVRLLMKEGVTPEEIKRQVEQRYVEAGKELEELQQHLVYHQSPYTAAEYKTAEVMAEPTLPKTKKLRAIVYVVLLLLPAINLSSMTRSRLRNRISEIGVRRAFGAKRTGIVSQIFTENLIMTLIGGAIGLCLSLIFLAFLSDYFVTFRNNSYSIIESVDLTPVLWHVFDFPTFFIAFGACFLLNVMSATVPAWKAASVEPATAINKSK